VPTSRRLRPLVDRLVVRAAEGDEARVRAWAGALRQRLLTQSYFATDGAVIT
jgi:hypothetical protein